MINKDNRTPGTQPLGWLNNRRSLLYGLLSVALVGTLFVLLFWYLDEEATERVIIDVFNWIAKLVKGLFDFFDAPPK